MALMLLCCPGLRADPIPPREQTVDIAGRDMPQGILVAALDLEAQAVEIETTGIDFNTALGVAAGITLRATPQGESLLLGGILRDSLPESASQVAVGATPRQVERIEPMVPISPRLAAATPPASTAAQPQLFLRIQDRRGKRESYLRGESYEVEVAVGPQGFLYCYLIDVRRRPAQFFPHPQRPDAAVAQGGVLHFPGTSRFSLVAAREGGRETVVCLNGPTNLGSTPALAAATDDGAIKARLERLAGAGVQMAGFEVHAP